MAKQESGMDGLHEKSKFALNNTTGGGTEAPMGPNVAVSLEEVCPVNETESIPDGAVKENRADVRDNP